MLHAFLIRTASWGLVTAFVIGVVGLVGDTVRVLASGASPGVAIVTGLTSLALGIVISIVVAPVVAVIARLAGWLAGRRSLLRLTWPLPVGLSAWITAAVISGQSWLPHRGSYSWVMSGFASSLVLAAILARSPRFPPRMLLCATLAVSAFVFDLLLPRVLYRSLHDLAAITLVSAGLAMSTGMRTRIWKMPPRKVALLVLGALWFASSELALVDLASPGWRAQALHAGAYELRLARGARAMVDFDADGFSPLFWGTDCDDLDERRHPYMRERPGGPDANCNGTSPPAQATAEDRGLMPMFGDPDLAPGAIDRVLLITIDCLRADAFRADVMPRLTAFATQGVVFGRMYAGGSRTFLSLPFIQHPTERAKSVSRRLAAHKITGTAVLPFYEEQVTPAVIDGFGEIISPAFGELWKAPRVTELALRDLERHPGANHYLWVHYFDAHDELKRADKNPPMTFAPEVHRSLGLYLEGLSRIDEEAGRMLAILKEDGRLARTLVIITGDHGEGFGEHGVVYHGAGAYEVLLRVPGAVVGPGINPGRYTELTTHRDLPATILGGFGLVSGDEEIERFGRSWLRLRGGSGPLHRFVVSRSARSMRGNEGVMPMASIVEGRVKYMETFEDGLAEMYDVLDDPSEERDILWQDRASAERLRKHLSLFRDLDGYPRIPTEE